MQQRVAEYVLACGSRKQKLNMWTKKVAESAMGPFVQGLDPFSLLTVCGSLS